MSVEAKETAKERKIHADATKDFFVTMITRDITLRDCIFDLLDNSIDGARRGHAADRSQSLAAFEIKLGWRKDYFMIEDNCGGILLSDAIDYAFHFGRRPGAKDDTKGGIGLYGIGMKRAIFKLGRRSEVISHAEDASFKVVINVDDWERSPDWDFEYEDLHPDVHKGTKIEVQSLNDGVSSLLNDPSFETQFIRDVARDYAFFIAQGLKIVVNGTLVPSYKYRLKQSDNVRPYVGSYEDASVHVKVLAGLADELPEDIPDELKPDKVEQFGWFVICNGRVVLAADKTEKTIWGNDGFNVWHPQYNGFAGYVFFESDDQRALPWTTTKRELDISSPLYRRAVVKMKEVSKTFTEYTNKRKSDITTARAAEEKSEKVDISTLMQPQALALPKLAMVDRPDLVNISYKRDRKEVEAVKDHIGNVGMSLKDLGIYTFEYYKKTEMD
ncbi:ATP-binding protein [Stenotrophomonas sp. MMGLT7]|uniref:ATP-binding protein n=1 Tax=Stenotrophomonas sp. MMGLT7 TaxID=2901227 RepID=UPI001E4BAD8C|nr:ATP-binding protein [Stenotrophomonas sp. MMGLT7]MCD7097852.1 ATP-binding protein [Stenotrophomonas sp. MMGLT7]